MKAVVPRSVPKVGRPKTPAIPEYWRLARSSLSALHAAPWRESVLVGRNFPAPERRELAGEDVEQGPDRRRWSRPEAEFGRFPCIYPVDQGFRPRDEFAIDCTHRHSVCCCRDFPRASRVSPRKSRDSAGFWPIGFAQPNRRPRVRGTMNAVARVFLCCQVGRFGFVPPIAGVQQCEDGRLVRRRRLRRRSRQPNQAR